MNYTDIKKLDEETLGKLTEGKGPVDECLCSILSPPETEEKKSIKSSFKRVLGKVKEGKGKEKGKEKEEKLKEEEIEGRRGGRDPRDREPRPRDARERDARGRKPRMGGAQVIDIPIGFAPGGNLKATREVIKKKGSCGKCGCDKEDVVLQHSFANIRITTPDISTFCPCPSHDCLPEKSREQLKNNIKVTIERVALDPDSENSETSIHKQKTILEPPLYKKSVSSLINAQYETEEDRIA